MSAASFFVLTPGLLLAAAGISAAQSPSGFIPPSAPAALTVPQPYMGPRADAPDLYQNPPPPPPHPPSQVIVPSPTLIYGSGYVVGPIYGPYASDVEQTHTHSHAHARVPVVTVQQGGLRLETSPSHAQVYVDGYYVGSVEDFGLRGRMMELTVGPHHVEIRASGYEPLSFGVRVSANEIVRYRGDLQSLQPASPPIQRAAPVSRTLYIIPNCYAGDRPPAGNLPSGCSLARLQVRK